MNVHSSHKIKMSPYGPDMDTECYACGAKMWDVYGYFDLRHPCSEAGFNLLRFIEVLIEKNE